MKASMIYRAIANPSLHYMVWFALPDHLQLFLNLATSSNQYIRIYSSNCEQEIIATACLGSAIYQNLVANTMVLSIIQ